MAEHVETQKRMCSWGHLRFLKTFIGFPTWIIEHFFNATHSMTWRMCVYVGVLVENNM
jgi:hypothetical protein